MDDLFEHQMESERDKAINGFYTHFTIFLAVIAGLALINLVSGDSAWVQWVVLGWGTGVAFHAYMIFIQRPRIEHEARERRRAAEERAIAAAEAADDTDSDPQPEAASAGQTGKSN